MNFKKYFDDRVRKFLNHQLDLQAKSQSELGREVGIDRRNVSKMLKGTRYMGFDAAWKMVKALGYKIVIGFEKDEGKSPE